MGFVRLKMPIDPSNGPAHPGEQRGDASPKKTRPVGRRRLTPAARPRTVRDSYPSFAFAGAPPARGNTARWTPAAVPASISAMPNPLSMVWIQVV